MTPDEEAVFAFLRDTRVLFDRPQTQELPEETIAYLRSIKVDALFKIIAFSSAESRFEWLAHGGVHYIALDYAELRLSGFILTALLSQHIEAPRYLIGLRAGEQIAYRYLLADRPFHGIAQLLATYQRFRSHAEFFSNSVNLASWVRGVMTGYLIVHEVGHAVLQQYPEFRAWMQFRASTSIKEGQSIKNANLATKLYPTEEDDEYPEGAVRFSAGTSESDELLIEEVAVDLFALDYINSVALPQLKLDPPSFRHVTELITDSSILLHIIRHAIDQVFVARDRADANTYKGMSSIDVPDSYSKRWRAIVAARLRTFGTPIASLDGNPVGAELNLRRMTLCLHGVMSAARLGWPSGHSYIEAILKGPFSLLDNDAARSIFFAIDNFIYPD